MVHGNPPTLSNKLRSIHSLTVRKHQLEQKRLAAARNKMATGGVGARVQIAPVWAMRRDTVHFFEDPLAAINYALSSLEIKPDLK